MRFPPSHDGRKRFEGVQRGRKGVLMRGWQKAHPGLQMQKDRKRCWGTCLLVVHETGMQSWWKGSLQVMARCCAAISHKKQWLSICREEPQHSDVIKIGLLRKVSLSYLCISLCKGSRTAILNLWVATPAGSQMTLSKRLPRTFRK